MYQNPYPLCAPEFDKACKCYFLEYVIEEEYSLCHVMFCFDNINIAICTYVFILSQRGNGKYKMHFSYSALNLSSNINKHFQLPCFFFSFFYVFSKMIITGKIIAEAYSYNQYSLISIWKRTSGTSDVISPILVSRKYSHKLQVASVSEELQCIFLYLLRVCPLMCALRVGWHPSVNQQI